MGALAGAFIGIVSSCYIVYLITQPKKHEIDAYREIKRDVERMEGDEAYREYVDQTKNW